MIGTGKLHTKGKCDMSSQEQVQLAPVDTCTHPKLASWQDIMRRHYFFRCAECGKQISIPWMSIILEQDNLHPLSHGNANAAIYHKVAGIIGSAFGETWEKHVLGEYTRMRSEI